MQTWKVTQLIVLEKLGGDKYFFRYPTVNLPNMCALCGEKAETYVPLDVRGRKIINTTYTISRRLDKIAFAEMRFRIPLCNHHDKEIKDYKIEQEKRGKESIILLAVSILICSLIAFFVTGGFQNQNTTVAGTIIISIFLGGLGGVMLLWPIIGILLPALVRLAQHKKYANPFTIKDFGLPKAEIQEIFNNDATLKLVFTFSNQEYRQEFMRQSNVQKELLAAIYHPDFSVHEPAHEALAANGCNDAAPAILHKFIEDIGKAGGTCWGAARALEKLGIPQPVEKSIVDQLAAGLKPPNTRDVVTDVLLLCGTENVIPHLQGPDPDVQIALLKIFGNKHLKEAVPAIIPLLADAGKSGKLSVAGEAAKTLKKIGTAEALAAVDKWGRSPNPE